MVDLGMSPLRASYLANDNDRLNSMQPFYPLAAYVCRDGSSRSASRRIAGLNGIALPEALFAHLGPPTGVFHAVGVITEPGTGHNFAKAAIWISVLMFIALACPNTLQILARYEPALGVMPRPTKLMFWRIRIAEWSPTFPWAIVMSDIAVIAIVSIGGASEFLYWQF
jgi:hypothetical protein